MAVDWGDPNAQDYAQQNIVTVNIHGVKVAVNENIATNVIGFLSELWDSGYRFKSVQGYNNRNIAGTTKKSNHAYGAAFDIDPEKNPQVKSGSAKYALPANVGEIAARHGLGWGGNWKNSKDYMHFEALGAPSSPQYTAQAAVAPKPVPTTSAPAGAPVADDTLPANATPAQINAYVAKHYGYLAAFLSDKELGPILRQAAVEDWSEADLTGAVTATKWWKTHSDATRQWDALNKLDQAKAKGQVDQMMATLRDKAEQDGIELKGLQLHDMAVNALRFGWNQNQINDAMQAQGKHDPRAKTARDVDLLAKNDPASYTKLITDTAADVGKAATKLGVQLDPKQAKDLAIRAAREGWTAEDTARELANLVKVGGKNTGQVAVTVDGLRLQAGQYGVPLSDQTLNLWTRQILSGEQTADTFQAYLREQAKVMRPWLSKQIDSGLTAVQATDFYRQEAARILDKDPESIDLFNDPKFSAALDRVDPKTGERGPMSFSDWQTYLRGTDEYKQTRGANEQAASFAADLAKDFGKLAV